MHLAHINRAQAEAAQRNFQQRTQGADRIVAGSDFQRQHEPRPHRLGLCRRIVRHGRRPRRMAIGSIGRPTVVMISFMN
jgi:hypothetical protein